MFQRSPTPPCRACVGAVVLVLLGACAAGRGHPVRGSLPRLEASDEEYVPPRGLEEPSAPAAGERAAFLFRGLEGVLRPLEAQHAQPVPDGPRPALVDLVAMEAAVLRRYAGRRGYGGPVRNVVALSASGRVPLDPVSTAGLFMDPAVERQVLAAREVRVSDVEFVLPFTSRRGYRLELDGMGVGPFRHDLRFEIRVELCVTPSGGVLLRYDPREVPGTRGVTLYRGGCLIDPDGTGSRVTEILILGTDIQAPPFFGGAVRNLARKVLRDRATNLWARAWAGRTR